jgi:protein gp37
MGMIDISKGRYWDRPWSLVSGCTPCSPGCDHCWAAGIEHHYRKNGLTTHETNRGYSPRFTGRIITHPDRLSIPIGKKKTKKPTVHAIWNDWAHEDVPIHFQKAIIHVATIEPQHTFLALTKRPGNAVHFFEVTEINPPQNWWTGLTVCNQKEADSKIPEFLKVPGKKFLSIEPMLGEINFAFIPNDGLGEGQRWHDPLRRCAWYATNDESYYDVCNTGVGIDAVILGGESGPGARPMHPDWVRSVRDQCAAAGVPYFFKGWGEWAPSCDYYEDDDDLRSQCLDFPHRLLTLDGYEWHVGNPGERHDGQPPPGTWIMHRIGQKHHARLLDGRTHDELPWVTP